MKIRSLIILMSVITALTLPSCGESTSSDVQESGSAVTTSAETFGDSYIEFKVSGELSEEDLQKTADIIRSRAESFMSGEECRTIADYQNKTIRLDFVNEFGFGESFKEVAAKNTVVEFRKGDKPDGEVILTKDNIQTAQCQYNEDFAPIEYSIGIILDEKGTEKFAELSRELAGTDTPLSLWINGEMIFSANFTTEIKEGNINIAGVFSQNEAQIIAAQLYMEDLPFPVEITNCEFTESK